MYVFLLFILLYFGMTIWKIEGRGVSIGCGQVLGVWSRYCGLISNTVAGLLVVQKLVLTFEEKNLAKRAILFEGVFGERKGCGMFVTHSLRDDRLKEVGLYFFI